MDGHTPEKTMPQGSQRATERRWNWRVAAAVVCMLQMLGISGAVILAAIDIETIIATGPIFGVLGIVVALGSRASRSISNAVFGLSTLAVSIACTVWIIALSLGPTDAQIPVTAALICYELLSLPVGCLALYRTVAPPGSLQTGRRWQFSIAQLLATTTLLAIVMGVGKGVIQFGANAQLGIAIALCVLTSLGIAIASAKGLAFPEETGESDRPTPAAIDSAGGTNS